MYRVDTSYNEKEVERVGDSGSEQSRVKSYENERDRVWKVEWKWNRDIKLTITLKKFRLFIPYSPISIRVYVKGISHHYFIIFCLLNASLTLSMKNMHFQNYFASKLYNFHWYIKVGFLLLLLQYSYYQLPTHNSKLRYLPITTSIAEGTMLYRFLNESVLSNNAQLLIAILIPYPTFTAK